MLGLANFDAATRENGGNRNVDPKENVVTAMIQNEQFYVKTTQQNHS